jgi:ADP-ribosylglycohydrolase
MNSSSYIKGVIFGQALGDAIGLCTEYMTLDEIKQKYTDNNISLDNTFTFDKIVQDYHRSNWKQGDWTDDTDLLILGIKSFIKVKGQVDPYIFRENLNEWFNKGLPECGDNKPTGCGYTISIIWADPFFLADDISLAARRAYIYNPSFPCSIRSNGGVMRTSWIGATHYNNIDMLVYNTINNCIVTHADPYCVGSALFINLLIAEIINLKNKNITIDFNILIQKIIKETKKYLTQYVKDFNFKIIQDINNLKNNDPFYTVILENFKNFKIYNVENVMDDLKTYINKINLSDLNITENISYTNLPVGVAVISLKKIIEKNASFMDVIMDIVNMGGDADTNCAVAGAVCGAFIGFDNLPQHLIDTMLYKNYLMDLVEQTINFI